LYVGGIFLFGGAAEVVGVVVAVVGVGGAVLGVGGVVIGDKVDSAITVHVKTNHQRVEHNKRTVNFCIVPPLPIALDQVFD
jgi:hypothetical protein